MEILIECGNFSQDELERICKVKNAVYVCDTTPENSDMLVSVFYGPTEHPVSGSRYFGLYHTPMTNQLMITNGGWIEDIVFDGALDEHLEQIIFSRYRHDYKVNGSAMIDGGRAYTRSSGIPVTLRVISGELTISKIGNWNYEKYNAWFNIINRFPVSIRYGLITYLGKCACKQTRR